MIDTAGMTRSVRIDMRCSATMTRPVPEQGRCQLLAGHHGEHALMFGGPRSRLVLAWSISSGTHAATDDWRARPWMRGYPFPAWFEQVTPSS